MKTTVLWDMWPYLSFILWNTITHSKYQKELSLTDFVLQNMTPFICTSFCSVNFSFHLFLKLPITETAQLAFHLYLKLCRVLQREASILKGGKRVRGNTLDFHEGEVITPLGQKEHTTYFLASL